MYNYDQNHTSLSWFYLETSKGEYGYIYGRIDFVMKYFQHHSAFNPRTLKGFFQNSYPYWGSF